MEKIGIIGAGISGQAIVKAYEKELDNKNFSIDVYDYEYSFGKGYPFRKDSSHVLVNTKIENTSNDLDNIKDFKNWLKEKGFTYEDYAPRYIYGQYGKERLIKVLEKLNSSYYLEEVLDIRNNKENNKWIIYTESSSREYDRIYLACGEFSQKDYYNLLDTPRHINDIYPLEESLKDIDKDHIVTIIGTSLSSLDLARFLIKEKKIKKIYMFSRSNVFPNIRKDRPSLELKYFTKDNLLYLFGKSKELGFEDLDRLLSLELEYLNIKPEKMVEKYSQGINSLSLSLDEDISLEKSQSLFYYITHNLNLAWYRLKNEDKEKFLNKYESFIKTFESPIPPSTGKIIENGYKENIIEVLEKVEKIDYSDSKYNIYSDKEKVLAQSDWVINATGLNLKIEEGVISNPLIEKLLKSGYVKAHRVSGLEAKPPKFNLIDQNGRELNNLHANGTLISGVQLRNNSILEIQRTRRMQVKEIYKNT